MKLFPQIALLCATIFYLSSPGLALQFETENAIVIEADDRDENPSRQGHQYFEYIPVSWAYPGIGIDQRNNEHELPSLKTENVQEGHCVTNQGKLGNCTAFEDCNHILNLKFSSDREEFDSHANLKEEVYEALTNRNCSSIVYAGQSKYGNICCPFQNHAETPKPKPSFFNSLFADPNDPAVEYASGSPACGVSKLPGIKIVNGTATVSAEEFPWMAVLFGKSGKPTCGGSLISETMILTAAHCVHIYTGTDIPKLKIHLGDWNLRSTADGPHETRNIKRIIKHKFFNIDSFVNDIALLRLDKPVKFTNKIQPICLPSSSGTRSLINQNLTVAGWGRVSFKGPPSPILLKVNVKVWDNARCNMVYKGIAPAGILPSMICAGDPGFDSCVGDSGGPLMRKVNNAYQQIGLTSFGKGCGTHPGVYTRVSEFTTWINSNKNK